MEQEISDMKIAMKGLTKDVGHIKETIGDIKDLIKEQDEKFVSKTRYEAEVGPLVRWIYRGIGTILALVITAIVAQVLIK